MSVQREEDGFTLIELLIVLVIMPMVIGAIAAAIIISYQDSGLASGRLTNSSDAQITSEYFQRDVQSAQYVTTIEVSPPYSTSPQVSPQVCAEGLPSNSTLVLGLYLPAGSAGATSSGQSVAYWVIPGAGGGLVRDSCTVNSSGTATFVDQVPISADVDSTDVTSSVAPSQFESGAALGWTPTTATTSVSQATTLSPTSNYPLTVGSTLGFANNNIGVRSTAGYQTPSCTVNSSTSFSCSGGSGQVLQNAQVRQQDSISSITLSVTEPESGGNYTYSLQAAPRVWASRLSGAFGPGAAFPAALITLSPAPASTTLTGGSINVDGIASFGGSLDASGNASFSAQSKINTDGLVSCSGSATVTAGALLQSQCGLPPESAPTSDPLGPLLANATPVLSPVPSCPTWSQSPVTLSPGIYNCPMNIPTGESVLLQPGVYELQQGITVAAGASVSMANSPPPQSNNNGALLYLTCPGSTPCAEPDQFAPSATVSITPLTASQSTQYFPNLGTVLQDVWLWQVSNDTEGATLIGNGGPGTAYLPGATVDLSGSQAGITGRIVADNITMTGGSLTLTGQ